MATILDTVKTGQFPGVGENPVEISSTAELVRTILEKTMNNNPLSADALKKYSGNKAGGIQRVKVLFAQEALRAAILMQIANAYWCACETSVEVFTFVLQNPLKLLPGPPTHRSSVPVKVVMSKTKMNQSHITMSYSPEEESVTHTDPMGEIEKMAAMFVPLLLASKACLDVIKKAMMESIIRDKPSSRLLTGCLSNTFDQQSALQKILNSAGRALETCSGTNPGTKRIQLVLLPALEHQHETYPDATRRTLYYKTTQYEGPAVESPAPIGAALPGRDYSIKGPCPEKVYYDRQIEGIGSNKTVVASTYIPPATDGNAWWFRDHDCQHPLNAGKLLQEMFVQKLPATRQVFDEFLHFAKERGIGITENATPINQVLRKLKETGIIPSNCVDLFTGVDEKDQSGKFTEAAFFGLIAGGVPLVNFDAVFVSESQTFPAILFSIKPRVYIHPGSRQLQGPINEFAGGKQHITATFFTGTYIEPNSCVAFPDALIEVTPPSNQRQAYVEDFRFVFFKEKDGSGKAVSLKDGSTEPHRYTQRSPVPFRQIVVSMPRSTTASNVNGASSENHLCKGYLDMIRENMRRHKIAFVENVQPLSVEKRPDVVHSTVATPFGASAAAPGPFPYPDAHLKHV